MWAATVLADGRSSGVPCLPRSVVSWLIAVSLSLQLPSSKCYSLLAYCANGIIAAGCDRELHLIASVSGDVIACIEDAHTPLQYMQWSPVPCDVGAPNRLLCLCKDSALRLNSFSPAAHAGLLPKMILPTFLGGRRWRVRVCPCNSRRQARAVVEVAMKPGLLLTINRRRHGQLEYISSGITTLKPVETRENPSTNNVVLCKGNVSIMFICHAC